MPSALGQGVHLETQTKKLAQTLFLFSACSLAAIVLFVAATTRHHAPAQNSAEFSGLYLSESIQPAGQHFSHRIFTSERRRYVDKIAFRQVVCGLIRPWSTLVGGKLLLYGGHRKRKRIRHNVEYAMDTPTRMNPLAVIPPRPVMPVAEQDKVSFPVSTVLCTTETRGCFAHRTATAPCQSRFRPTTLVSSQTRFGRLK